MRLTVAAVGRQRSGPERIMVEDYLARAERAGRRLGLTSYDLIEVEDRKGAGKSGEAVALIRAVSQGARIVALDERGSLLGSPAFAKKLASWRDQGVAECAFVIGGADGLDSELVAQSDMALSFGPMVWPHMLARVMLAEQLYRATSILAGSPYHRT